MTRPTIHATNLPSRTQHGPGRLWCAMIRPRAHEQKAMRGWLPQFAPPVALEMLRAARVIERVDFVQACHGFWRAMYEGGALAPGALTPFVDQYTTSLSWPVADGDTIFCSCARPENRKGGSIESKGGNVCHLERVARWLVLAGWDVKLYGRVLTLEPEHGEDERLGTSRVVWADTGKDHPSVVSQARARGVPVWVDDGDPGTPKETPREQS